MLLLMPIAWFGQKYQGECQNHDFNTPPRNKNTRIESQAGKVNIIESSYPNKLCWRYLRIQL